METASQYFNAMVADYDSLIRRAVPRYDEMLARSIEYMPPRADRVLELGCGTGNLTLRVAARYPGAALTLVDGAGEMLELSRHRLAAAASSCAVTCVETTFERVELQPASFDLVTSSISLHHVVEKPALFRRLFALLAPGGALVYSDQMRGRTDAHHALNMDRMRDFWRESEPLSLDEQRSLDRHSDDHDHYVSVADQLAWLDAAGFADVDCVWRNWMWGVITARA